MAEVVISELGSLPRFTDVHRHPTSVCKKFRPTMVAFNCALVFVGGNRSADGKTRRNADTACQGYEVSVKIGAVASPRIARVKGVAAAPAGARLVVSHPADHMIVERFRPLEIVAFFRHRFTCEGFECLVHRNEL